MLESYYAKEYFVVATDGEIELVKPLDAKDDYLDFWFEIRLCNSEEIVGDINYRQWDDETYLGNVGCSVKIDHRGNNYALKALLLLKTIIVKHGYTRMIISAEPSNKPSLKTIKKFGARLICYRPIPKNHMLYKGISEHQVVIFVYDIEDETPALTKKTN